MAENTKERIISAVFSFYRDGKIKKISLSKIAAEVGISKAAIFRHFANREELEETLLQTVYDRFASLVTAVQGMLGRGDSSAVLPFIIETLCRHTEYINYLRSTSPDFSLDTFVLEGKKRGVRMFDSVFAPDGSVQNKCFYYTAVFVCVELLEFVYIWNFYREESNDVAYYSKRSAEFIHNGLGRAGFLLSDGRMQSLEQGCLACVMNARGVDAKLAAVSAVVAKKGYAELTMDSIAAELGMAKSSFYSIYKNKEDMILSLLESEFSEFGRILALALRDAVTFDECIFSIVCTTTIYFFKRSEILEACKWIEFQRVDGNDGDNRLCEIFNSPEHVSFKKILFAKKDSFEFPEHLSESHKELSRDLILSTAFGEPLMFLAHGIRHGFPLEFYSEIVRAIYKMLMSGVVSYTKDGNIFSYGKKEEF